MKMRFLATVMTALACHSGSNAQVPSNTCSTAPSVGPGNYAGSTNNATSDGAVSCGASTGTPDVWLAFPVVENKLLVIQTCGGASWDTVLAIHSACPGTEANQLACNDDSCGLQSRTQARVTAGNVYYIRISGFSGAVGAFTVNLSLQDPPPPPTEGPDVIVGDLIDVARYGSLGALTSYAVGTDSCNLGDVPVEWQADNPLHPVIAQNMYRLKSGRFEQLGASWVKHGFASLNGTTCGTCEFPPNGGAQLGIGCSDPYGSGLNGSQSGLGPRSEVNATNGVFRYPFGGGGNQTVLSRRIQVLTTDITPAQNVGALYFVEGHYVTQDDAQWGNGLNNASYRQIRFASATSSPAFIGGTLRERPAIYAWADFDPTVTVATADVLDGTIMTRFHVASKVVDNGNGTWTYTYAVHNLNSDRSASGFRLPRMIGTLFTDVGFRDVPAHSGEPYNSNDWAFSAGATSGGWRADQTFAQNPDANALRWGTMYTYWFKCNRPPVSGNAAIDLFKPAPGGPAAVWVQVPIPSGSPCRIDINGDNSIDMFDCEAFVQCFEGGGCPDALTADFDRDGSIDFFDYDAFIGAFELGC